MPKLTEAIVTIIKYSATMSLIIKVRVFGVVCSVKEWKFLNSAILVVESFIEVDERVAD